MLKSKRPPHLLPPPLHHSLFHYVASIPFPPTSPLLDHVFYKLQSNFLFIQTQKQFSIFNFYLFGFPHPHSAFNSLLPSFLMGHPTKIIVKYLKEMSLHGSSWIWACLTLQLPKIQNKNQKVPYIFTIKVSRMLKGSYSFYWS